MAEFIGTEEADDLDGTDEADTIQGLGGDDTLDGHEGDDELDGGEGDDRLFGRAGNDELIGDNGLDRLVGAEGNDHLNGGIGDDDLFGDEDDDLVRGGSGADRIFGGTGNDDLRGNNGDDNIKGESGVDSLEGGDGDDFLNGGGSNDQVSGGEGADNMFGGGGDDVMLGGAGDDKVKGNAGNDNLFGGDGNDAVFGRGDNDTAMGDAGDDRLFGEGGNDFLDGGEDNDRLTGGTGNDGLNGRDGDDTLLGDPGSDAMIGEAGNDQAFGGDDLDAIWGGLGNDRLRGQGGNDLLWGGAGDDNLKGDDGDDQLEGEAGNDDLFGGTGDDVVLGGLGDDNLRGNDGTDWLVGGEGADIFNGGAGGDYFEIGPAGFDPALEVDIIGDFVVGEDAILLTGFESGSTLVGDDMGNFEVRNASDEVVAMFQANEFTLSETDYFFVDPLFVSGPTLSAAIVDLESEPAFGVDDGGTSDDPFISGDGKVLAFESNSDAYDEPTPGDTTQVVRKDLVTGEIGIASRNADGEISDSSAFSPSTNVVGTALIYESAAANHGAAGQREVIYNNPDFDIFFLASVTSDGTLGDDQSFAAEVSDNGFAVAFTSQATNFVAGDDNGTFDVFVKNLQQGNTSLMLASRAADGTPSNGTSAFPKTSSTGLNTVFYSNGTDLVATDLGGNAGQFYFFNQNTQTVLLVSVAEDGTAPNGTVGTTPASLSLSNSGVMVAFISSASNLVEGDTNGVADAFVKNMSTGEVVRVSEGVDGLQANGASSAVAISGDGTKVAFTTAADNLIEGSGGSSGLFIKDLTTGSLTRLSLNEQGIERSGLIAEDLSLNDDGSRLVFDSADSQLVARDGSNDVDVFSASTIGSRNLVVTMELGTLGSGAHTVLVDWGDGSPDVSETLSAGESSFGATHYYGVTGSYNLIFKAEDELGRVFTELKVVTVLGNGGASVMGTDPDEIYFGGRGDDLIEGEGGDDVLTGGQGDDRIFGGNDDDGLWGDAGDDLLKGNGGFDSLYGGDGDDSLSGGGNDDELLGGAGNDDIAGDAGEDFIDGGAGDDTIQGGDATDAVLGGLGDDEILGDAGDDQLFGDDADNVLPEDGNDSIYGGEGDDDIFGEGGSDLLSGDAGEDQLFGSAGNDTLLGGDDADELNGGSGNDALRGNGGGDLLEGSSGDDELLGGGGGDTLDGGTGNDLLTGNSGVDFFVLSEGSDTADDFVVGVDFLDATAFAAAGATVTLEQDGDDAVLTGDFASDPDGVMRILGVSATEILDSGGLLT